MGRAWRYGWAADAIRAKIPELKGKSITFNHIEQAAEQGHMRSYYRFASHTVHPASKSLHYDIGLIRQGEVFLSGPSNYGLAEPATASCGSLQQATGALLMTKPTRQRIASLMALHNIIRETSDYQAMLRKPLPFTPEDVVLIHMGLTKRVPGCGGFATTVSG